MAVLWHPISAVMVWCWGVAYDAQQYNKTQMTHMIKHRIIFGLFHLVPISSFCHWQRDLQQFASAGEFKWFVKGTEMVSVFLCKHFNNRYPLLMVLRRIWCLIFLLPPSVCMCVRGGRWGSGRQSKQVENGDWKIGSPAENRDWFSHEVAASGLEEPQELQLFKRHLYDAPPSLSLSVTSATSNKAARQCVSWAL